MLAEQLPSLAMSRPFEARRKASAMLAGTASPLDKTYALQAIGIVERDHGELADAVRALRRGIRLADRGSLVGRRADMEATLGTILAIAGRKRAALAAFDSALDVSDAHERGRILVRRSPVLFMFGDMEAAHRDSHEAARVLARVGDVEWEGRALSNLALASMALGRFAEADAHLDGAQRLAEIDDVGLQAAMVLHNRADNACRQGDIPRALRLFDETRRRYEDLGLLTADVLRDLAAVHLTAGMTEDAAENADEMVAMLEGARDAALRRSDGFITAATVHLAAGNPERAIDLARRAARSCKRQGHVDVERHARVVLLRAQHASGHVTKRHARAAAVLAAELRDRYSSERLDALVLAGTMALATGLPELAAENLTAAAAERNRGSALRRATAWYAQALLAKAGGDRAAMLRACARGLDVLDTHALSLGATELRARATVHGSDLAVLATRQVVQDGTARELLRWTERWRSSLHALPWPAAEHDPLLAAELGRLRAAEHVLGAGTGRSEAGRRRIEERIRRHVHGRYGDTSRRRTRFDVATLLDHLGDRTMVSIVGVKGERFHAVVARRGRVRHVVAGSVADVRSEVDYARFALRGAALAGEDVAAALLAAAEPGLARVQETMLGPAVRELGDGPVVLVPPSTLQSVPWGALPGLRDRDVTVAPSAAAWIRARRQAPPSSGRVTLIAGSGLATSAAEVDVLSGNYPDATVLAGEQATAEAALDALDGSWLAHIGAHCRYRGDNPMFSALELADGPLTVYDLERMQNPPYRMLLTACESGVGSPAGVDELLGLTTSLSALGTAGLLASVVPVSDAGSVDVSLVVHERLRAGDDLSTALLAARQKAWSPVTTATAWAFLALGAA